MSAAEILEVRGLTKAFGDHTVLDGVDLVVPGAITAVVGQSGCGKTTLLRLIAGFEAPDSGTVSIAGREVAGAAGFIAPHRRDVGYVAQDGALFPHLTVGQNVAYGLPGGRRGDRVRARVAELLEMVSLSADLAARRPHELSGGQQQRVALARALARQPAVMLLDEPFSSLDTGLRASTRNTVAQALSAAGVTSLLVTHDQEEALSIADQVAVMRQGRFTQVGAPEQLYSAPEDRFTAAFLGDCVFLPATVRTETADCALGTVAIRPTDLRGAATIMVRPEQLAAAALTDAEPPTGVGTVIASEFLGSDVVLTIELAGERAPITVRQASIEPPKVNTKVRLTITGTAVVFGS